MPAEYIDWTQPVNLDCPLNRGKVSWFLAGPHAPFWGGPQFRDIMPASSRGGGYHGTPSGMTWVSGRPGGAGSLYSPTVNDYCSLPNVPLGIQWTVCWWFYLSSDTAGDRILMGSGDSASYYLCDLDKGSGTWLLFDGGSKGLGSFGSIAGKWTHFALTYDASSGNIGAFINGASTGSAGGANGNITTLNRINGRSLDGLGAVGLYDDVAAYNRILSAGEVFARYEDSRRGYPEQLAWLRERRFFLPDAGGSTAYSLEALAGSYSLTGQTASLEKGSLVVASAGSYLLTGQTAGLLKGSKVSADSGPYTLTGQSASLLKGFEVSADSGTYTLSGQDVSLVYSGTAVVLTADNGAYTLTGISAFLEKGGLLTASNGSYALTGQTVTLLTGFKVAAGAGSFSLTGQDASLKHNASLAALNGSYNLSGQAASLLASRLLPVDSGSYALTGSSATLAPGKSLTASSGSFLLTGSLINLLAGRKIVASTGVYVLTGTDTIDEVLGGPFTIAALQLYSASSLTELPLHFYSAGATAATGVPL